MGPATTSDHALEELRRAIVAGELRPGQRIGQDELAQRLGMSVAPVREALRTLEQEGQVTYIPRRGYFVTELAIGDLEEIYELRSLVEDHLAGRLADRVGSETMVRIESAAADFVDAVDNRDVVAQIDANRRFHLEILAAAERPQAMRLVRQLWDSTESYRALYYNLPRESLAAVDAHDRIIVALRRGDAERLVAELGAHRERALEVLREILPPAGGTTG